jgi:cytochrome P450
VAQAAAYVAAPFETIDVCMRRYGDFFTLRFPIFGDLVCACHPEAVRQILTGDESVLRVDGGREPIRPLVGDYSLLVAQGPEHLRRRRLLLSFFHGDRALDTFSLVRDTTSEAVSAWRPGRISLLPEMEAITLDVILGLLFGASRAEREALRPIADPVRRHWTPLTGLLLIPSLQRDLGPFTPWAAFRRDMARAHRLVHGLIAGRRRELRGAEGHARPTDLLGGLLDACIQEGVPVNDGELCDELMTLLVAGYQTTALSLCWLLAAILSDRDVQRRLEDELRAVVGGGPLMAEHLPRLRYVDAAVRESLRLYPVSALIGMSRKLAAPMALGGYELPAGASVIPLDYAVHRRPDLYPEPERFLPDRFLDAKVDAHTWIPFGGGVRRCIGATFAIEEMKIVLAMVLLSGRLEPTRQRPLRGVVSGGFIAPAGGTSVLVA